MDIEKLKALEKTANAALFDLHDYMRRSGIVDGKETDDRWRFVYSLRAQIGRHIAAVIRWEEKHAVTCAG